MTRALVIGGNLFLGRALVERLLERGDDVVIMHRSRGTPFGARVQEIQCDRNDVGALRSALSGQSFDVFYDNVYDWERGTTAEQVSAAALAGGPDLRRYVFTSSVAVYPEGSGHDEQDALVPSDHPDAYGRNKAETERELFRLHRERGVPVATLRPAFIYGPHNPYDREAFFWDRIMANRPIIVPDDGSRLMQFVHVDDVAHAATLAAEKDEAAGHAFNLASPPLTQDEFIDTLARVAGREARRVHVARAHIEAAGGGLFMPPFYFGVYLDLPAKGVRTERARTLLGLEPRPLEEGLRETFLWYGRQHRPQPDFAWEDALLARV